MRARKGRRGAGAGAARARGGREGEGPSSQGRARGGAPSDARAGGGGAPVDAPEAGCAEESVVLAAPTSDVGAARPAPAMQSTAGDGVALVLSGRPIAQSGTPTPRSATGVLGQRAGGGEGGEGDGVGGSSGRGTCAARAVEDEMPRAASKTLTGRKRWCAAELRLDTIAKKRKALAGVTEEDDIEHSNRRAAMVAESRNRKPVSFFPTVAEEFAAGMVEPWFHATKLEQRVFEIAQRTDRYSPVSLNSYKTYVKKYCIWAFRSWRDEPRGERVHPYMLSAAQVTRFVREVGMVGGKEASGGADADANNADVSARLRERYWDISFDLSGINSARVALTFLRDMFALVEDEMRETWKANDATREHLRDARYALIHVDDRAHWTVFKMKIWGEKSQALTKVHRSLAANGGKAKGQFSKMTQVMESISTKEVSTLSDWLCDARHESPDLFAHMLVVTSHVLMIEGFMARPQDLRTMRYASVGVLDTSEMTHTPFSRLQSPVYIDLAMHKGSQDTAKSITRWAVRHADVQRCPIYALMSMMALNFSFLGVPPPDVAARDKAHTRAKAYSKSVDKTALLNSDDHDLISWHARHIFCAQHCTKDVELRIEQKAALQNVDQNDLGRKKSKTTTVKWSDEVELIDSTLGKMLNKIRTDSYVESGGTGTAVYNHLLHRRGSAANRAVLHGASFSNVDVLGGWSSDKVMTSHYIVVPPPSALIAAAGCDATRGMYYLEYGRDTLNVPLALQEKLFPWLEEFRAQIEIYKQTKWPGNLEDEKATQLLGFLKFTRVALWQDWAVMAALDEQKNLEASAKWSFWQTVFFRDAGEDWVRLREEARALTSDASLRIPKHVQSFMDGGVGDAMAQVALNAVSALQTLKCEVSQLREAHAAQQASMAAFKEALTTDIVDEVRRVIAECPAVGAPQEPCAGAPSASVRSGVSAHVDQRQEFEKLRAKSTPTAMGQDIENAVQAWEDLMSWSANTPMEPDLKTDVQKHFQGQIYHALWYRTIRRWVQDRSGDQQKPDKKSTKRMKDAFENLYRASRGKWGTTGMMEAYELFKKDIKRSRAEVGSREAHALRVVDGKVTRRWMDLFDEITETPENAQQM